MKIQRQNGTLTVQDILELSAANARSFRNEICAAFSPGLKTVEIDLSQISFMDSCGVGALASLYKAANGQGENEIVVVVRLLNPQPPVQQVLELTRMHHIFEIVTHNGNGNGGALNGHSHANFPGKSAEPK